MYDDDPYIIYDPYISGEKKEEEDGGSHRGHTERANIKEEKKLLKAASNHFVFFSSVWDISWSPAILSLVGLPFWNQCSKRIKKRDSG